MGLMNLFKRSSRKDKEEKKEKSCEACCSFSSVTSDIDYVGGDYMTIYKSSCSVYGDFASFHSGNINGIFIDQSHNYNQMLTERARHCDNFTSRVM
jgi:hypothetical protein